MKDFENALKLLLKRMGVEMELTTENLRWLGKNLVKEHKNHSDFPEAIHLIATLINDENIVRK